MACINTYSSNPDYHHLAGPRISFSTDFVVLDPQQGPSKHTRPPPAATAREHDPSAPDFEFSSATSAAPRPMITADEVFFGGRLLPVREQRVTTLREEMLSGADDEDGDVRAAITSRGWKGLWGIKKSCGSSKKGEANSKD